MVRRLLKGQIIDLNKAITAVINISKLHGVHACFYENQQILAKAELFFYDKSRNVENTCLLGTDRLLRPRGGGGGGERWF